MAVVSRYGKIASSCSSSNFLTLSSLHFTLKSCLNILRWKNPFFRHIHVGQFSYQKAERVQQRLSTPPPPSPLIWRKACPKDKYFIPLKARLPDTCYKSCCKNVVSFYLIVLLLCLSSIALHWYHVSLAFKASLSHVQTVARGAKLYSWLCWKPKRAGE